MVLTLAIPLRTLYGLEDFITLRHLGQHGEGHARDRPDRRLRLPDGNLHGLVQRQHLRAVHDVEPHVRALLLHCIGLLLLCNILVPQALWFPRVRTNPPALFVIAICVNVGMWLERFVIVVASLSPRLSALVMGHVLPTVWDWATFVGTIGLFVCLLFLFIRFLPMISIFEMRELVHDTEEAK